jgi:hypothetical protein
MAATPWPTAVAANAYSICSRAGRSFVRASLSDDPLVVFDRSTRDLYAFD